MRLRNLNPAKPRLLAHDLRSRIYLRLDLETVRKIVADLKALFFRIDCNHQMPSVGKLSAKLMHEFHQRKQNSPTGFSEMKVNCQFRCFSNIAVLLAQNLYIECGFHGEAKHALPDHRNCSNQRPSNNAQSVVVVGKAWYLVVKSRLVVNSLHEQIWLFSVPFF